MQIGEIFFEISQVNLNEKVLHHISNRIEKQTDDVEDGVEPWTVLAYILKSVL